MILNGERTEASIINTPLRYVKLLFKLFFDGTYLKLEYVHKDDKYSLRNTSRIQNIEFVG